MEKAFAEAEERKPDLRTLRLSCMEKMPLRKPRKLRVDEGAIGWGNNEGVEDDKDKKIEEGEKEGKGKGGEDFDTD